MYLSKLEVVGFKSFAQPVNLRFDSGISAIVGPNGCGKTNIVDAIRWVLGEQRYSALRSDKMEDVIFNGTKLRKPLGMAEVSLEIENTKGILPSEYSTLTIGRRVYRSGESEYLLNKVPCRLKDILDLFMDTGMGADAYSVIELKMVESILSDKTDERRRLFEEAAGVTKYKHRRKAAYRKLESVQADLVRVNDIVSEVQKSVNSLERQAKKAEQFNEVNVRLKALEIDLMEREYAQLHERLKPLTERLAVLGKDKDRVDVDLKREELQLDALRFKMNEVEKRLAEAQRDLVLHLEKITQVDQKNLVAAERMKALDDNMERFTSEKQELQAEKDVLETLTVTLQERAETLQTVQGQVALELETKQADQRNIELQLEAKKTESQSLNDRIILLIHRIADEQRERDRKKGKIDDVRIRSARASEENTSYEAQLLLIDEDITALSAEDKRLRRGFTEAEVKFYEAEAAKKGLKEKLDELHRREVQLASEIEQKSTKVDFLKGLIESREGLPEGVRFLATTDQWNPPRNVTVADAVIAEDRFRGAIELALGEYAGLIIVDSQDDVERGIALLQQEQRGKATFVALDRVPTITSRRSVPNMPGVYGWAVDLAIYEGVYAPLFNYLLDRVLVVDTRAIADNIVESFLGIRCVTLEGEMVTGVGITRGGSKRYDEGGMIGKHMQIEELRREIAAIREETIALQRSREEITEQADAIQLKAFTEAVKSIEKEMNGAEMRIAQLEFEKKRAGDIIAKNSEEQVALASEEKRLFDEIATAAPALQDLEQEKGRTEQNVIAVSADLKLQETEWSERSKAVNELSIRMATAKGEHQNALSDQARARTRIADIITTLDKRENDVRRAHEEKALTASALEENTRTIGELRDELRVVASRKTEVEQENIAIREEIHQIELRIKDERRHHDDSLQVIHDLELKVADLKAKADHINARSREEFEQAITLKTYPEDEFVDFAKLRDEIQGLREKLKSLGNINFAAFEEYTGEKDRFEFLSTQRTDLLEAEKTLIATIEEINTTAQKKFLETFAQTRTNFIETFKSLFDPGDECDLRLEEGVDPLEARIDITAKPRGKRPTSIDLLSGGEKTLTAIALLFAIYLVKPSPFCILDEVDAPLDDANIDRFTRIINKFSNNTQFIVVTHNKRTMEAANALYGITMQEEGVSKIVTVRFNHGANVKSAALASG